MSTADLARDIGNWLSDEARLRAEVASLRAERDHWKMMAVETRQVVHTLRAQDARTAMVNIHGRTEDMQTVLYIQSQVEDVYMIKMKLCHLWRIRGIMSVSWWQLRFFHNGDELRDTMFLRGRHGVLGMYEHGLYVEIDQTLQDPGNPNDPGFRPRFRSRSRPPRNGRMTVPSHRVQELQDRPFV